MVERLFFDFAHLFDAEEYLYFMEETLRDENTPAQVDFILQALGVTAPSRFLDLGCGHGRHANELARRGHGALGIDLVEGFLAVARNEAERDGLNVQFVNGNMCSFEVDQQFDHAICLFDAFGFFDDVHQESMLRCTREALAPGGRLLLDLRTRELMVRIPPVAVLDKGNGDMMIDRSHFDIESGRLVDRRTYMRGGKQREVAFSVRLYSFTEIKLLLRTAGFEVETGYGGFDGSSMSLNKPRTIVVARKVDAPGAPP
jgi:SAM-dependent methyltransferase